MRAYSTDFRHSIVQAYEAGQGSQRHLARLFGVSLSCVQRLLQRYRQTGSVAPKPHGGGQAGKIIPYLATVAQLQDTTPDATLAELCAHVGGKHHVRVSPATMSRALRRIDRPRKKNVSRQ